MKIRNALKRTNSSKKLFLCVSSILTSLTGCTPQRALVKKSTIIRQDMAFKPVEQSTKKEPIITIWIHGTRPSAKMLKTLHTIVEKPAQLFGVNLPYFHSELGLNHISSIDQKYRLRRQMEVLTSNNPNKYPPEHAYIFGWSGKLSFAQREREARNLYYELVNILTEYQKKYESYPKIKIITHSHGGNVALNLAKIHNQDKKIDLVIDQLILLGCPVQKETAHYSADPIFKNVYSLYSKSDFIQILDPQGIQNGNNGRGPLFSKRLFPYHPKVKQVYVTLNGRPMLHLSFILNNFIKHLPTIIQKIDDWHQAQPSTENETRKLRIFIK